MPTQTTTENYEEKQPDNKQAQQPAQVEEQEHTDDIGAFDEDTEELSTSDADLDDDEADLSAGDEGIDDAPEQQAADDEPVQRQAADDADIESGKRIDKDENELETDVERDD